MDMKTALSAIADLALPRVCVVCGAVLLPQEKHICTVCLADLPETHFAMFSHNPMSAKLNDKVERDRIRRELLGREDFSYAAALYFYNGGLGYKAISQALKYRRDFGTGKLFAGMLGGRLAASPLYADVDLVVPVPLHWERRWRRGYNQAEVIGQEVAAALGCRCLGGALKRRRRTRSQAHVHGSAAKAANVSGAFAVRPSQELQQARHILLVDDVFTTGATLSECHIALREALGPSVRISVATLGFVG